MAKDPTVIEYIFPTIPDVHYIHGLPQPLHTLNIVSICDGREIEDEFKQQECISLRELFNNLDGDDRAGRDYTKNRIAGAVLEIASMAAIQRHEYEKGPNETRYGDIVYDDIVNIIEQDFNWTLRNSTNAMSSYLFGRHVFMRSFREANPELYETMLLVCEDILWSLIANLTDIVDNIEDVFEIINSSGNMYTVARWEEDYMIVTFLSEEKTLSEKVVNTILNRGMISNERYNHLYGSRRGHSTIPTHRRSRR